MSTSTGLRRRPALLLAGAGVGAVATLVGTASPAAAADGVVVSLEPTEVAIAALPIENFGGDVGGYYSGMGMSVSEATALSDFVPVPVQFTGTITVELPDGLDASTATADLVFDDNEDGIPEATYSSRFASANPKYLVSTPSSDAVEVTLPADDPFVGDVGTLSIGGLTSSLGPAFGDVYDTIDYEIEFDTATPPAPQTVHPVLTATSQIPCGLSSWDSCPLPTPATPGSTVTLVLTEDSILRELGLTDLSGVQVALAQLDEDGFESGPVSELTVDVTGPQASFAVPADAEPGSYGLYVLQETPTGGFSTVFAELTVEAPAAAPVAAPAPPAAPQLNPGLRSNTGVHLPEVEAEAGTGPMLAAGAGLLLVAGAGAAVVRGRRRPVVEGSPCGV
ncbi:hypothetical protein DQ239_07715 [Blastococcus sp. TF02-09]|uniref:hypothetical protein n=1 Tax=Blastococcus sp. TF02-09 TaxID=2250576 RepID=UPI000DE9CDD9|nr:hypothetical protein [Blastococcus sp. TF02-9]RBY78638.1 hypothetical protein DQ239_07715 [Blastococcus sp. TF02-9]